jgi:hypothetical protein
MDPAFHRKLVKAEHLPKVAGLWEWERLARFEEFVPGFHRLVLGQQPRQRMSHRKLEPMQQMCQNCFETWALVLALAWSRRRR